MEATRSGDAVAKLCSSDLNRRRTGQTLIVIGTVDVECSLMRGSNALQHRFVNFLLPQFAATFGEVGGASPYRPIALNWFAVDN